MIIFCCACDGDVEAVLTNGAEIYPHRDDLARLPFWRCEGCGNYVGCHHKSNTPTKPLGIIPTREIKRARNHIHKILDPIWQKGLMPRGKVYGILSSRLGRPYHTAEIRSVDEAREIYKIVREIDIEARTGQRAR